MEWVIIWLIGAIIVAIIAANKERSVVGWFLFGLVIWPIALVAILVSSNLDEEDTKIREAAMRYPCPFCAEMIMREAKICPHCRSELIDEPPPVEPVTNPKLQQNNLDH